MSLTRKETRTLKAIERNFKQETDGPEFVRQFNQLESGFRKRDACIAITGTVAVLAAGIWVFGVNHDTDDAARQISETYPQAATNESIPAITNFLSDPAQMTQLGVCSAELSAQADYLRSKPVIPENPKMAIKPTKPSDAVYDTAAQLASANTIPCESARPDMHVSIMYGDHSVSLGATDVTVFDSESWCADREYTLPRMRTIGDTMMQRLGSPCTDAFGAND